MPEVGLAQLVHDRSISSGTAVAEQLGTDPQLADAVAVGEAPVAIATMTGRIWMPASVSEYAARCPRVASSRVSWPAATSRLSLLLRMLARSLLRVLEQLAEVAPVVEDHVARHEHGPRVAEHLDGGVDRAIPTWAADENLRSLWSVSTEPITERNHKN
jgi:hypothetical protein